MLSSEAAPVSAVRKPRQSFAGYIIFVVVVTVMVLTNPGKQQHLDNIVAHIHKMEVSKPVSQIVPDSLKTMDDIQLKSIVRMKVGNDFKNFYLFSYISNEDSGTLTVGVFGNVWLDEGVFQSFYY